MSTRPPLPQRPSCGRAGRWLRRLAAGTVASALGLASAGAWGYGIPPFNAGNLNFLDSAWYYQSIQNTIVDTAAARRAAPAAVPALTVAAAGVPRAPARMAAAYATADRAQVQAVFTTLLGKYGEIERRFDIPPGDLAGAFAAFIAGSTMAYRNQPFPDAHFAALVRQMRAAVAAQPGFAAVAAADKRDAYEQLAILGMFMAASQMALQPGTDPDLVTRVRQAGKDSLERFLKVDAERLQITGQGLQLK